MERLSRTRVDTVPLTREKVPYASLGEETNDYFTDYLNELQADKYRLETLFFAVRISHVPRGVPSRFLTFNHHSSTTWASSLCLKGQLCVQHWPREREIVAILRRR